MIGVFRDRHLGDCNADVDAAAKQIGARCYARWERHKFGNLEEVKAVFYKRNMEARDPSSSSA